MGRRAQVRTYLCLVAGRRRAKKNLALIARVYGFTVSPHSKQKKHKQKKNAAKCVSTISNCIRNLSSWFSSVLATDTGAECTLCRAIGQ